MNNLNLNRHDWKFYGPSSLYDTTYKCKNCNGHHTESTGDINSTLPAFGCTVKDESIIPKMAIATVDQLVAILNEIGNEIKVIRLEIAKLKNHE